MRTKKSFQRYISYLIFLVFLFHSLPLFAQSMEDYCIVPPYVKRDVKPNILLMMDNSAVMGDAAYTDAYDSSNTYSGLFKPNLMYRYSSNNWVPDATGIYSGNLLNWATTSKYDLLESILVGGKSTSRQTNVNNLISLSNTWTKTLSYTDSTGTARRCIINVSGSNIEIKDEIPNSCGYLDTPPHPLVSFHQ